MKRIDKLLITSLVLVCIDQIIKLIIHFNYLDKRFNLLFSLISFEPYLNIKYSWINSMGNFGWNRIFHIILVLVLLLLAAIVYGYLSDRMIVDQLSNTLFAFLFAGGICSLIDKIFWGGSLDYICLKGLFIFDLKDVYLTFFEIILVMMLIFNYRGLRGMKEKELIKDIAAYLKSYVRIRK